MSSHTASRRTIATVFAASLLAATTATLVAHPPRLGAVQPRRTPASRSEAATLTARSDILLEIPGPKVEIGD